MDSVLDMERDSAVVSMGVLVVSVTEKTPSKLQRKKKSKKKIHQPDPKSPRNPRRVPRNIT